MDEKTRILKQQITAIKDEASKIKDEVSKIYTKIEALEKAVGEDEEPLHPKSKAVRKMPLSGV